jgi:hypothetical protein
VTLSDTELGGIASAANQVAREATFVAAGALFADPVQRDVNARYLAGMMEELERMTARLRILVDGLARQVEP